MSVQSSFANPPKGTDAIFFASFLGKKYQCGDSEGEIRKFEFVGDGTQAKLFAAAGRNDFVGLGIVNCPSTDATICKRCGRNVEVALIDRGVLTIFDVETPPLS